MPPITTTQSSSLHQQTLDNYSSDYGEDRKVNDMIRISYHSYLYTAHSLLLKLRCQVHTEVAKCLADEDHLTEAIEHLDKVTIIKQMMKVTGQTAIADAPRGRSMKPTLICQLAIVYFWLHDKFTKLLSTKFA